MAQDARVRLLVGAALTALAVAACASAAAPPTPTVAPTPAPTWLPADVDACYRESGDQTRAPRHDFLAHMLFDSEGVPLSTCADRIDESADGFLAFEAEMRYTDHQRMADAVAQAHAPASELRTGTND